jgi:hypothetical protein
MPHRLITTNAMLDRCQAPPPLSPPSLADILEEDDDLYFEDDDNEGNLELAALNVEFRADEEWEAEEPEKEDTDNLDFRDDGPDLEKKAIEQRAILTSYELAKKAEADAHARKEANEE